MSTPVIEHIGQFLEDAINEITEVNGYNYDLTATRQKRFILEDEVFDDLTVYILQGECKPKGEILVSAKTDPRIVKQQYLLWAVCLQSDKATEAIDTKLNKVRSDIEKKLCGGDHTCGGYAISIDVLAVEPTDTPETGILVTVEVIYSVQWGDPYIEK